MLELNGLLLVDKPADMTSHDVVAKVRRALKQKSVGHTGTLDPLATGLMILVLGEATKLSDYILAADKAYEVKVRLGVHTDTLDRTGQTLETKTAGHLGDEAVAQAVDALAGDFQWPVPLFSAAKIAGKKLYEYGRKGEDVALPVKTMSFWNPKILKRDGDLVDVALDCSKGSFIRSWSSELGRTLGVGGSIEELRRTRVGRFDLKKAQTLEAIEEAASAERVFGEAFVPMARALPAWKSLMAGPKEARLMANGQVPRDLVNRLIFEQKQAHAEGVPVFVKVMTDGGQLLAILAAEPGQGLKIRRVFRAFA